MNLLMVNDEALLVETMKQKISWDEYGIDEVFTCYSAKSSKKCIHENKIDIMLCDIEMPGEDGISLLRWVRGNAKEIECIFLTCHASFQYAQEAISLGCRDYLLIPAKYEDIGSAVLKVVRRIELRREEKRYLDFGKKTIKGTIDQALESQGAKKSTTELIADTEGYIMRNLGKEDLSVNEIAEQLYLHPVYLNRIFKKEKGVSIGHYIITKRMELAQELLQSEKLNANIVAEKVGYRNYTNFYVTFKKYFGCAPSQFRHK